MSGPSRFASHAEAVKAGWFSRRHETSGAHLEAREAYQRRLDAKFAREEDQREHTVAWKATKGAA